MGDWYSRGLTPADGLTKGKGSEPEAAAAAKDAESGDCGTDAVAAKSGF